MRAARYARVSTAKQTTNTSIPNQLDRCASYIDAQGWDLVATFVEPGESGENLDRPQMTAARQAARRGEIDVLLVYTLDRLTRNLDDLFLLRREFKASGVQVFSVHAGLEATTTDSDDLAFVMLRGLFAQREREAIRRRTREGRERRVREGKHPGGPTPYGYAKDAEGRLEISDPEAEVVRRVYDWVVGGLSANRTADLLNGMGTPSPGGGRWWAATVTGLVHNPLYAGEWVYGQRAKNAPEIPVKVPPIVEESTRGRAQAALKANRRNGRPSKNRYLLSGMIRCQCGAAYCASGPRREGGPTRYRCQARSDYRRFDPARTCRNPSIRAADLESEVWSQVEAFVRQPHLVAEELGRLRAPTEDRVAEQLASIDQSISDRRAEIDRYLMLYGRGSVPIERLDARMDEVRRQVAALESYRAAVLEERRRADAWEREMDSLVEALAALREKLDEGTEWECRRHCVELLLKGIVIEAHVDENDHQFALARITYGFKRPDPLNAPIPVEAAPLFGEVASCCRIQRDVSNYAIFTHHNQDD